MRWIFYIFLVSQLFNFLGVFAEKIKKDLSELNTINWEKVKEKKPVPLKKIIWKNFQTGNQETISIDNIDNFLEKT